MGLFKRKRKVELAEGQLRDQLRVKIGCWFWTKEKRLAKYLNRKTRTLGVRQWLALLISFCLVAGGYLIHLLIGVIN